MNKIVDKYSHDNEGYNPYLISSKWQVAQLNYSPEQELENIVRLDVHRKTDEVFILTRGEAILIGAEIKDDNIMYDFVQMVPGITYNIRKDVWHNIVMNSGTEVIIVEDSNTHLPLPEGDYEFYYLSDTQKEELIKQIENL